MKKVIFITDVRLSLLQTQPPTLIVKALGKVPSTGWTDARLVPCTGKAHRGFYSFDLVADSPDQTLFTSGLTVEAELHWLGFPDNLAGVKVFALDNSRQKQKPRSNPG